MPAPDAERRSEPESPSAAGDVAEGPPRRAAPRDLLTLAAVLVVTGYLWSRAATLHFWVDEGIAVGISSHSFTSIPDILREDGSPPLYYLLLHLWMAMFGSSEVATHLLSLGFALATIPAALWAGWSLFGRRTGWMFALMALNPYLASYANETRMYTLMVLLALLASATFAHAFVFRRRRYLPTFSLLLTLLIYTHNGASSLGSPPASPPSSAPASPGLAARSSSTPPWPSAALRSRTCPGCRACSSSSVTRASPSHARRRC